MTNQSISLLTTAPYLKMKRWNVDVFPCIYIHKATANRAKYKIAPNRNRTWNKSVNSQVLQTLISLGSGLSTFRLLYRSELNTRSHWLVLRKYVLVFTSSIHQVRGHISEYWNHSRLNCRFSSVILIINKHHCDLKEISKSLKILHELSTLRYSDKIGDPLNKTITSNTPMTEPLWDSRGVTASTVVWIPWKFQSNYLSVDRQTV